MPERTRSTPLLRIGAALFGVGLVATTLLAIEVGFRIFGPSVEDPSLWVHLEESGEGPSIRAFHEERVRVHRSDPVLFWRGRPNVDVEFRGVRVRTNSLGLRDDEVPPTKAPDELRILVLGESSAFGDLVEQEETFNQVLERALAESVRGCRVSVINAGVTGYSLYQSARWLERDGLGLEPDVVLTYHGFNDFLPTAYTQLRTANPTSEAGLSDRRMGEARARFPASLDVFLYYNSAAWAWMRNHGSPSGSARANEATPAGGAGDRRAKGVRVPPEDRRLLLSGMQTLLDSTGGRLVILVPVYRSFTEHRDLLLEQASRTGTPIVDLGPAVPESGEQRQALFFADGLHPTPALHDRIGRHLHDALLELGREGRLPRLERCVAAGAAPAAGSAGG